METRASESLSDNGRPLWLHYTGFQAVLIKPLPSNSDIRHSIIAAKLVNITAFV